MDRSKNENSMKLWPQVLGVLAVCLSSFSKGSIVAYPTKALPQLRSNGSIIVLTEIEESIFAAAFGFSCIIFAPLGGIIAGWIGRKKIIVLTAPFVSLGLLLIGLSKWKTMLFFGRFLSTICLNLHSAAEGVYISEIVHPKYRASFLVLLNFSISCGIFFIWVVSYFCTWSQSSFIAVIAPTILTIIMIFLPESPFWLVGANQVENAKRSLQFYRGPDYDINEEFCEMQEKHLSKVAEQIKSSSWKWTLERFFSMAFLKPFSCAGILSVLSMACGTNVVSTYMFFILQESGSLINPNLAPIIVGSVCLITSILPPFILRKVPTKIFFTLCQFIMTISWVVFGIYLHQLFIYNSMTQTTVQTNSNSIISDTRTGSTILDNLGWLPLMAIITSYIMRASSTAPISSMLQNELYPTEIRTLASGITKACMSIVGTLGVMAFPPMKRVIGLHGILFVYASISMLSTIWGYIKIPETRGKSLTKVEEMYEVKK